MNTAFSLFELHLLYFVSVHWRNHPCQHKFPSASDLVTIFLLTVKSKVTAPLNKNKGKKPKQNHLPWCYSNFFVCWNSNPGWNSLTQSTIHRLFNRSCHLKHSCSCPVLKRRQAWRKITTPLEDKKESHNSCPRQHSTLFVQSQFEAQSLPSLLS